MCGKHFQVYDVHIPRKCSESRHFYSCLPNHSKLSPKFLLSHPRQIEVTFPKQNFFEDRFHLAAERGGGNYDLLYHNSISKFEDDSEH